MDKNIFSQYKSNVLVFENAGKTLRLLQREILGFNYRRIPKVTPLPPPSPP